MRRLPIILISILFFFSSCDWQYESRPAKEKIHRFDRLVDEYVSLNSFSALQRMNTEYPQATRLLIEDVLEIGKVQEPRIEQRLRTYYLDSTMQVLLDAVHKEYPDLDDEEKELGEVFSKLKEIDPDFRIPGMYAQISGLNQSIVVGDDVLGISLDKYLGQDFDLYKKYYYLYQRSQFNRNRIVPDALYYYLSSSYPLYDAKPHTLLDFMLDYGKFTCVIARLRNVSPYEQAGIDKKRMQVYKKYETAIWNSMLKSGTLETKDLSVIRKFMIPQELSDVLTENEPAQIGIWIGIRIMESYMKNNPDVGLKELLRMHDYSNILEQSGYTPS